MVGRWNTRPSVFTVAYPPCAPADSVPTWVPQPFGGTYGGPWPLEGVGSLGRSCQRGDHAVSYAETVQSYVLVDKVFVDRLVETEARWRTSRRGFAKSGGGVRALGGTLPRGGDGEFAAVAVGVQHLGVGRSTGECQFVRSADHQRSGTDSCPASPAAKPTIRPAQPAPANAVPANAAPARRKEATIGRLAGEKTPAKVEGAPRPKTAGGTSRLVTEPEAGVGIEIDVEVDPRSPARRAAAPAAGKGAPVAGNGGGLAAPAALKAAPGSPVLKTPPLANPLLDAADDDEERRTTTRWRGTSPPLPTVLPLSRSPSSPHPGHWRATPRARVGRTAGGSAGTPGIPVLDPYSPRNYRFWLLRMRFGPRPPSRLKGPPRHNPVAANRRLPNFRPQLRRICRGWTSTNPPRPRPPRSLGSRCGSQRQSRELIPPSPGNRPPTRPL